MREPRRNPLGQVPSRSPLESHASFTSISVNTLSHQPSWDDETNRFSRDPSFETHLFDSVADSNGIVFEEEIAGFWEESGHMDNYILERNSAITTERIYKTYKTQDKRQDTRIHRYTTILNSPEPEFNHPCRSKMASVASGIDTRLGIPLYDPVAFLRMHRLKSRSIKKIIILNQLTYKINQENHYSAVEMIIKSRSFSSLDIHK